MYLERREGRVNVDGLDGAVAKLLLNDILYSRSKDRYSLDKTLMVNIS